jgi:hypothetical protein
MKDIDVLYILDGSPTDEEVKFAFSGQFEWHNEEYLVRGIKKYLRTDEHKKLLADADLTIEDCLNGRYDEAQEPIVHRIYADWNKKIGRECFYGG